MPNTHQTLQDIADILSFESDKTLLKARLGSNTMDWDHLVRVGSSHLVLPAIYCRLKTKNLLGTLPKELESYLKEITDLNRERNQQLLAEAQQISQWFQEVDIDHVFLKGTAMLASGYYEDIGERMVGDIDILVSENGLNKSFTILVDKGFSYKDYNYTDTYIPRKHLPRLKNSKKTGAVEIHRRLLNNTELKYLDPSHFIPNAIKKSINIPCDIDLIRHTVMNYQINDNGYLNYSLGLRNTFDALILLKKTNKDLIFDFFNLKKSSGFFKIGSLYFKEFRPNLNSDKLCLIQFLHKKSLSDRKWNLILSRIANFRFFKNLIINNLYFFIVNKQYRIETLKNTPRILRILTNNPQN